MKKLKLLTAICTFLVGGVNLAHAQTDVTSQYIVNADFSGTYSRFLDINTDLTLTQMQTEPSRFPSPKSLAIWNPTAHNQNFSIWHQQSFFPLGLTVIWLLLQNTPLLLPHTYIAYSFTCSVYWCQCLPLFLRVTP